MTKKLEEEFNLPKPEELSEEEPEKAPTAEEIKQEIAKYKSDLVWLKEQMRLHHFAEGLEQLDREMDNYADKAMNTFEDLVDFGKNVEDRHAVPIAFDSAVKC